MSRLFDQLDQAEVEPCHCQHYAVDHINGQWRCHCGCSKYQSQPVVDTPSDHDYFGYWGWALGQKTDPVPCPICGEEVRYHTEHADTDGGYTCE